MPSFEGQPPSVNQPVYVDQPLYVDQIEECVDLALEKLGNRIVMGTPLGLGKPNHLINAFYRRAVANPDISLEILTALSLERPRARTDVEKKFLQPFVDRVFGDYLPLDYMQDLRAGKVPDNIVISEFYIKAGAMIGVLPIQSNYISTNYTFAARDINARGVNLIVQMVAQREIDGEKRLSLSCNTDITFDLHEMMQQRAHEAPVLSIAQVHNDLPFMLNRAVVKQDFFDVVLENKTLNNTLFSAPNLSVSNTDFMLGLRASSLIKDGGTLQIGIGALGDAITYATLVRHQQNADYRNMITEAGDSVDLINTAGGVGMFSHGLYGCSEMFVNGFMHLRKAGVLKRLVYDDIGIQSLLDKQLISTDVTHETIGALHNAGLIDSPLRKRDVDWLVHWGVLREGVTFEADALQVGDQKLSLDINSAAALASINKQALGDKLKHGIYMHGGFFIGPKEFYDTLNGLPDDEMRGIAMDSVRCINRMSNEPLQSLQRRHARFINTGMMVTLSGAVVSDGLENGQVVSGVGGQYNFVAQAHELPDAKSVICIRSTRGQGKKATSNIVAAYGHTTIPRHLRDIVVTEYGIADLRGKTDAEIILQLIRIADSRFQQTLLDEAIAAGKVKPDTVIPDVWQQNTPEKINRFIDRWRQANYFPRYPLGSDFTAEEQALAHSLLDVKALQDDPPRLIAATIKSVLHDADDEAAAPFLKRIGLDHPDTAKELVLQQLLLLELEEHGYLKPL
jgi:acyl-CoA hydrolase